MFDFTVVTAVSNSGLLKKLQLTLPTWHLKLQFQGKPLLIFKHGLNDEDFDFARLYFPDLTLIDWDMPLYDTERELMLSSFILGVNHIKTPYWFKIDSDCFAVNSQDFITDEDFEYDMCSHPWGYTKPGYWLQQLDNFFYRKNDPIDLSIRVVGHRRIISFCCLHKTDFVREVKEACGDRLPVPSHDTVIWYYAEKWQRKWRTKNFKRLGFQHVHHLRSLKNELSKQLKETA